MKLKQKINNCRINEKVHESEYYSNNGIQAKIEIKKNKTNNK